jgi:hypothetical protein
MKLSIRQVGRKFAVVDADTGLTWRTLDSRQDATDWVREADNNDKKGKK